MPHAYAQRFVRRRVKGAIIAPVTASDRPQGAAAPRPARILGIDPGSQRTGVGIIDIDGRGRAVHVYHETLVVLGEGGFPERLKRIYDGLCAIIGEHGPTEIAIERVFMARNADSALKLGQARGAAICAAVSKGIEVHEYAASEVKQAVVGGGRADKRQVQHMVGVLLGLREALEADAGDALAIALTHAHTRASLGRVGIPRTAWRRRR